jgi:hypothetical protein
VRRASRTAHWTSSITRRSSAMLSIEISAFAALWFSWHMAQRTVPFYYRSSSFMPDSLKNSVPLFLKRQSNPVH